MKTALKKFFLLMCVVGVISLLFFLYVTRKYHISFTILKYNLSLHSSQIENKDKVKVSQHEKIVSKDKSTVSRSQKIKLPLRLELPFPPKYNGSLRDDRQLLAVLATTWPPEKEKIEVHKNVARMWGWWPEILQPIVYTNLSMRDGAFDQCMKSGWKFLPIQETKCRGIPVLKVMVTKLLKTFPNSDFYGYVNSDILFDSGLIETFKFVKKHTSIRPVMLIGQRTNVDFIKPYNISTPEDVSKMAKDGKVMKAYAIDFFLTDRSFPWDKLPELVIGRHQYDNYMVDFAIRQKALLIDVTQTVKAVHQTTKDGNNSGNHRHDKNCNRIMIKKLNETFYSSYGFVTCAKTFTKKNKSGNITLATRKPWRYCRKL